MGIIISTVKASERSLRSAFADIEERDDREMVDWQVVGSGGGRLFVIIEYEEVE